MKVIDPLSVHGCYDVFHSNNTTYVVCPYHVSLKVDESTEIICPHERSRIYSVPSFHVNINGTTVTPNVYDVPKRRFAITTLEKNSSKWIYHWLNYHKGIGAGFFFIYDNNSSYEEFEKLLEITREFNGIIFRWNYTYLHPISGFSAQITQQNHSLYLSRNCIDRLALTDLDEYIVVYEPMTIDSLLNHRLSFLWWLWFGAGISSTSTDPRDYTLCKQDRERRYSTYKMIIDPTFIDLVAVHDVILPVGLGSTGFVSDQAVLHHYRALNCRPCLPENHETCEYCRCTNPRLLELYTSTTSTPGK